MELSPEPYRVPFLAGTLLSRLGYEEDALYLLQGLAEWSLNDDIRFQAHRDVERLKKRLGKE